MKCWPDDGPRSKVRATPKLFQFILRGTWWSVTYFRATHPILFIVIFQSWPTNRLPSPSPPRGLKTNLVFSTSYKCVLCQIWWFLDKTCRRNGEKNCFKKKCKWWKACFMGNGWCLDWQTYLEKNLGKKGILTVTISSSFSFLSHSPSFLLSISFSRQCMSMFVNCVKEHWK